METPTPHPNEDGLLDSGEFSNFFNDVSAFWNRYGTAVVGVLAVAAIIFAGYNLITKRAEAARQYAWSDLLGSASVESLEITIGDTSNASVRATANLRAGDLLLSESRTADRDDVEPILAKAVQFYQAALDEAPHPVFELNALDGLAVVAESRRDVEKATQYYGQLKETAAGEFPYWEAVAERRLALLPTLTEPVEFAPERVVSFSDTPDTAPTDEVQGLMPDTAADPAPGAEESAEPAPSAAE